MDELAHKRWMTLPEHINVFCPSCCVMTIVDYSVDSDNHNLVL